MYITHTVPYHSGYCQNNFSNLSQEKRVSYICIMTQCYKKWYSCHSLLSDDVTINSAVLKIRKMSWEVLFVFIRIRGINFVRLIDEILYTNFIYVALLTLYKYLHRISTRNVHVVDVCVCSLHDIVSIHACTCTVSLQL